MVAVFVKSNFCIESSRTIQQRAAQCDVTCNDLDTDECVFDRLDFLVYLEYAIDSSCKQSKSMSKTQSSYQDNYIFKQYNNTC